MLDGWARRRLDPVLDRLAGRLAAAGATPDGVTLAAFALGMLVAACIAFGFLWAALLLGAASRLGDGLDGALAKRLGASDRGGYLDIVLDFAFYGAVPLAFVVLDPAANGLAGAALLAAFYVNGASFLAFAAVAARRGLDTRARGPKNIVFSTGLAEATETMLAFAAFCLFPSWFAPVAWAFAALTAYTALSRIVLAWRTFR